MVLFKRVEIDLDKERERIKKASYNQRQRKALIKLVDLFEQGKFQECLNHVNDYKAFPRNRAGEYDEKEHIGIEIGDLLHSMAYHNYYTRDELLNQAKEILDKERKKS
jgi:hypothetical protein